MMTTMIAGVTGRRVTGHGGEEAAVPLLSRRLERRMRRVERDFIEARGAGDAERKAAAVRRTGNLSRVWLAALAVERGDR